MDKYEPTSRQFGAQIKVSQKTLNHQLLKTIEALSQCVVDEALKEASKHIAPAWTETLCLHVEISIDFSKYTIDKDVVFQGSGTVSLQKEVNSHDEAQKEKKYNQKSVTACETRI